MTFDSLAKRQQQLEVMMVTKGKERFNDTITKSKESDSETSSLPGSMLLRQSITPLILGIRELLQAASQDGRKAKHVSVKVLEEVGAEEAAFLIAKAVLNTISNKVRVVTMSVAIAKYLIDELKFRKLALAAPGLFNWKMKNFKSDSYDHMKRSLDATIRFTKTDVEEYNFSHDHIILIGIRCLDLFIRHTGYVTEIRRRIGQRETEAIILATPSTPEEDRIPSINATTLYQEGTMDWIKRCIADNEANCPVFMPTVIPPQPWTNTHDGGYWFALRNEFSLMRGIDKRHQLDDLDNIDMPIVYKALNAIQNTAWRVNEAVLNIAHKLVLSNREVAGIPRYEDEPEPNKPADIASNETARKVWRKAASAVHDRNHARVNRSKQVQDIVKTAQAMLAENTPFYFPHNLDFRGRAYAIPVYLQPQGDDLSKGLLRFAEGVRLGTRDAVDWLAVHGANTLAEYKGLKLDKLPRSERIAWIEGHSDLIRSTASDPLDNLWWTEADSPFCFLAFCFEWAGYLAEGLEFKSSIPVAMDGSCNGLQHYSALLRDEVGGRAVNLVPSETPQDIYRNVAEKILVRLQTDALEDGPWFEVKCPKGQDHVSKHTGSIADLDETKEPLITYESDYTPMKVVPTSVGSAHGWLKWGKVNRSFCKRQVMTLPYGSEQFGFNEQIVEYIKGLKDEEQPEFCREKRDGFPYCLYMAGLIWNSLGDVVVSAQKGMEWFQALARICVKEELPIQWVTPSGLPINQGYRKLDKTQIDTMLSGIRYQAVNHKPTERFDKDKQVSAIAPNIIHSLDASAMMFTTCSALDQGVTSFAMIHDSFGTHAAFAQTLSKATRQEFVKLYQDNDILEALETSLLANVDFTTEPGKLTIPFRPRLGTLDLTGVLDSKYFFS